MKLKIKHTWILLAFPLVLGLLKVTGTVDIPSWAVIFLIVYPVAVLFFAFLARLLFRLFD